MKSRVWVLIILALLLVSIGGYIASFMLLGINERVEGYLHEIFSAQTGLEFTARSLSILPWSLRFDDVVILSPGTPVSVAVGGVRIQYSLLKLILNKFILDDFQPLMCVEEFFLDEPAITWILVTGTPVPETRRIEREGMFALSRLPGPRINIVNGTFVFRRGESSLVFADGISGWLAGSSSSEVDLNVQGKVLSDTINTTARGVLSRLDNRMVIDMVGTGCNLAAENIDVISGDIEPSSGTLDFSVHAEIADGSLSLSGNYAVTGGAFLLKTLDVGATDIAVRGHLNEEEIFFDSVTGMMWGVMPRLSGIIRLKPEPAIELTAHAENIELAEPFTTFFPHLHEVPNGSLSFSATVDGPLRNLSTVAHVDVDSLVFKHIRLTDVSLDAGMSENTLRLENIAGRFGDYSITGSGRLPELNREGPRQFSFLAEVTRVGLPDWCMLVRCRGGANIESGAYDMSADISHEGGSPWQAAVTSRGMVDIQDNRYTSRLDIRSEKLVMPVTGEIAYRDEILTCTLGDSCFTISGEVRDLFGDLALDTRVNFSELPLFHYLGRSDQGPVLDGSGMVTGVLRDITVKSNIRLRWGRNLNSLLSGAAEIRDILSPDRTVSFDGQLVDHYLRYSPALTWQVSLSAARKRITTWLSDPAGAILALEINPESGDLSGRLDLDEFPLEWIIDVFVREEFSHRGKITGTAEIGGTLSEPFFSSSAPLTVTDMTLAGVRRLDGTTVVSGSLDDMRFRDVLIRRDGMPVISADGVWERGSPFILRAHGESFELGAIEDVISDTRETDGTVDYAVTMSFTRRSGTIEGTFAVTDGHFYNIPFDRASGRFSGGSTGFLVDDFIIERDGVFSGIGRATSGYFWRDVNENPGLMMNLTVEGDLVRALPKLTSALRGATGECTAELTIGGTWQEPITLGGELVVRNGRIEPAFLFDEVTDISAVLRIDSDGSTETGLLPVRIVEGQGMIGGTRFRVGNIHVADEEWGMVARPELVTVQNERINLDFGILRGWFEGERGRSSTLTVHVPGFMEERETGVFELTGQDGNRFSVGAYDGDEGSSPYVAGRINVLSGDIYYPLLDLESMDDGDSPDTAVLRNIFWDIEVQAGSNVNYVNEHNLQLGRFAGTTLWQNEIKIDENSSFRVTGCLDDDSFRVTGIARSTNGFVVYYGYRFDVEYAELELDTENQSNPAILTGRARAVVYDDTLGTENEIFLHVDFVDRESGRVTGARGDLTIRDADYYNQNRPQTRFDAGALGIIEIRFSSNNPADDTQEKILAKLGFSPANIGAAAARALTAGIDNYYFNPLLRPFEETIKRMFRLDMVKISPSILGSFAQRQLSNTNDVFLGADPFYVDRSRIMLGEYFLSDWFLSYTGQYGFSQEYLFRRERGFSHDIGLQYNVDLNLRFQGRYIYDEVIKQDDTRIEFRYDFTFD